MPGGESLAKSDSNLLSSIDYCIGSGGIFAFESSYRVPMFSLESSYLVAVTSSVLSSEASSRPSDDCILLVAIYDGGFFAILYLSCFLFLAISICA